MGCPFTKPVSGAGRSMHVRRQEPVCDECRAAENAYQRKRYRAGLSTKVPIGDQRMHTLWNCYRLRPADLEEILARQNGTCAICDQPFRNTLNRHTDHKHGCNHPGKGKHSCKDCVRGILCRRCNTFIAALDDEEWLKRAFAYLGGW